MGKLLLYVTAVLLAISTMTSCRNEDQKPYQPVSETPYPTSTRTFSNPRLQSGHERARNNQIEMILRRIAGIYAGTVKVTRTPTGYQYEGNYPSQNPGLMEKVRNEADKDSNGTVTLPEAKKLKEIVSEAYAR